MVDFERYFRNSKKHDLGKISIGGRDLKKTKEATYSSSYSDRDDVSKEGLYCSTYKGSILFYCLKN